MNIVGDEAVIEIEDNGQGLLPFGNNAVNIAAKNTSNGLRLAMRSAQNRTS